MENLDGVRLSLEKAYKFMEGSRNPDGLWSDFLTLAGESVYWVSGYVGYALSRYGGARGSGWLTKVGSSILENQEEDGGWGYGPGVPADADSTSWCLRFLSRLGMHGCEARERASLFLLRHQNRSDGGFRTYYSPREVGRYMHLDGGISFEGWLSSQLCVTALAVEALTESGSGTDQVDEALDFIRGSQNTDGYWNSYWWGGRLYATVHCMEVLKSGGIEEDLRALNGAQGWVARTQLEDGSWSDLETEGVPFSTALALSGLMVEPSPDLSERIGHGIDWLMAHQLADGSWASGYILRIPHPSVREPWRVSSWKRDGRAINAVIKDHRRLFTTATAFMALSEFMEQRHEVK